MPAKNPRVSVTLKPDQFEILQRIAEVQGTSMSSFLADVWEMASPVMDRVARLMAEAKTAQESVKDGLREAAEEAYSTIEPQAHEAMLNFDLFEELLRQTMETGRSSGGVGGGDEGDGARAPRTPEPPPSNTGVRFTKNTNLRHGKKGPKP